MPRTKAGTPHRIPEHITLDPVIDEELRAYVADHPGQTISDVVTVGLLWFFSVEE
jgi:hypothetical protein